MGFPLVRLLPCRFQKKKKGCCLVDDVFVFTLLGIKGGGTAAADAEDDEGKVTVRGEHVRLAEEQAGVIFSLVVGEVGVAAEVGDARRLGEAEADLHIHLLAVQVPLESKVGGSVVLLVHHVSDVVKEDLPPVPLCRRRRRIFRGRQAQ